MGNWFVYIALFGWIPAVLTLFRVLPSRRAVIVAFLAAWLFLPMAGLKLTDGMPPYDKMSATCVGVLLGMLAFDSRRLTTFRTRWIDLPMLIWCLCPLASSLANDLGLYDGTSSVFRQTVMWGLPYFIGRLYFTGTASLKDLAVGLFVGGLIYVPLCLFEVKMSPQLHNWVYGYHQHDFSQTMRMGGWRPTVFMQHGLAVGMWMCMTSLVGVWLCYSRALPRSIWRIPTAWALVAMLITAVLCKSTGAIVLLIGGMAGLFVVPVLQVKWVIWTLVIVAPLYMVVRAGGIWDGRELVTWTTASMGEERAGSLDTRIANETALAEKAMQRPVFGWGGWGRNRVTNQYGQDTSITDGLWVIYLGTYGIVGLTACWLAIVAPASLVIARMPARLWSDSQRSASIVLACVIVLYWLDCLANALPNPVFMVVVGGLASCGVSLSRTSRKARVSLVARPPRTIAA